MRGLQIKGEEDEMSWRSQYRQINERALPWRWRCWPYCINMKEEGWADLPEWKKQYPLYRKPLAKSTFPAIYDKRRVSLRASIREYGREWISGW